MKFIKIHRTTEVYYALPAEKKAELSASMVAFGEKYKKAGKLIEYYTRSDAKGGFAIWDVESNEELLRLAGEYPMTPYTDFETFPVVDFATAVKMVKENVPAKKAEKK